MAFRTAVILLAVAASAAAQECPGWRGPRGDGTSPETGFPLRWGPDENVLWKVPVPGKGHSSPILWGERLFLSTQMAACMVFADGGFFVTGGYPELHILGIRPDGDGNVTKTHLLWRDTEGVSYVPSPIAWGPHFFLVSDGGIASCLEAKTGKRLWKERLGPHHSASPVAAGGRLCFPDDRGRTHVLKAGPAFEVEARNDLGDECTASPALSRGRIYFRRLKSLWCLGEPSR